MTRKPQTLFFSSFFHKAEVAETLICAETLTSSKEDVIFFISHFLSGLLAC